MMNRRKKSYFYDFLENLIRSTAYNGENAYIKTYGYDYSGNMTAETDESGNRTAYEYDTFGNVCPCQSEVSAVKQHIHTAMNTIYPEI